MTENEMMRVVNLEICEPFTQDNPPKYYHPYFTKDILVVLGWSGGVVVWPGGYNQTLLLRRIVEHEGNYWLECDGPEPKTACDMWDEYKILEAAMGWVKHHSTHIFDDGTDEVIGFSLPWVDLEEEKEGGEG